MPLGYLYNIDTAARWTGYTIDRFGLDMRHVLDELIADGLIC